MITSCVILNYNDSETTKVLLDKIINYNDLHYIIVVDNKSTDDSFSVLEKYKSEKIHVLLAEHNGGYGYGNNLGIKYAYEILASDYILIVNPDVCFSNECVRELRQVLINEDDCVIATPVPLKPNGDRQEVVTWKLPTANQEILSASVFLTRILGSKVTYNPEYFEKKSYCSVDVVQGSMLMVDAPIMVKYGMYDEEFFLYGEEQVLAYKLKENGYKSIVLLNQFYVHNHSVSINKTYNSLVKTKQFLLNSKLLYLKKYLGLKGLKLYFTRGLFSLALIEMRLISVMKNRVSEVIRQNMNNLSNRSMR
jgi:N-acetylglucosaminyl-diphospho-decaprenol L-rhamnosyltransferase